MSAEPLPDWLRPPPGGFTADDLDRIPGLPTHTELIDGSLVLVSPPTTFHALVVSVLEQELRRAAPASLRVRREITVTLEARQRLEPDVLVVQASAVTGPEQTDFQAQDVVMVVEVVSADSEKRDRERKPQLYAQAAIRHFWRVESVDGQPVAYVHELDPATGVYALTGIHRERIKLGVPFEVDIDLTDIDNL